MIRRMLSGAAALLLFVQLSLSGVVMPCGTPVNASAAGHQEGHGGHAPAPSPGDDSPAPSHCLTVAPCSVVMVGVADGPSWEAPMVKAHIAADRALWSSVSKAPELPPPRV